MRKASLTNLNAGRDKDLFYYQRINCAINNDRRQDSILLSHKRRERGTRLLSSRCRGSLFCYIFSGRKAQSNQENFYISSSVECFFNQCFHT